MAAAAVALCRRRQSHPFRRLDSGFFLATSLSTPSASDISGCEEGSYSLPMWLLTGISGTPARSRVAAPARREARVGRRGKTCVERAQLLAAHQTVGSDGGMQLDDTGELVLGFVLRSYKCIGLLPCTVFAPLKMNGCDPQNLHL
ncbi:hypothetical protein B296_00017464 [Ensete ventricosum]|uniref:Uncharacterized protein n=1 Tax=Ensete ventricosum TaxID=4639 RepID=A0A427B2R2_ENSVE|nr:hypothetical protein B296_00017464 [Ensete ventricosum]